MLVMWVLIGNMYKRKRKEKRRKEERKIITTLGSCDDSDGWGNAPVVGVHLALCSCTFYSLVSALRYPLEDLHGACSRKFMIFCVK